MGSATSPAQAWAKLYRKLATPHIVPAMPPEKPGAFPRALALPHVASGMRPLTSNRYRKESVDQQTLGGVAESPPSKSDRARAGPDHEGALVMRPSSGDAAAPVQCMERQAPPSQAQGSDRKILGLYCGDITPRLISVSIRRPRDNGATETRRERHTSPRRPAYPHLRGDFTCLDVEGGPTPNMGLLGWSCAPCRIGPRRRAAHTTKASERETSYATCGCASLPLDPIRRGASPHDLTNSTGALERRAPLAPDDGCTVGQHRRYMWRRRCKHSLLMDK